jgi:septal ring factor EnvC (AmiA/AmiB activator)
MEIMQAMQLMQSPPPVLQPVAAAEADGGVTKLVVGGICAMLGAIILALIFWLGSSVSGLTTTVTKMSANVDQLQKSIADLQQTQGTATQQLADIRTTNAKQDAEQVSIKEDLNRMKERIRIVEGQKPLPGFSGDR